MSRLALNPESPRQYSVNQRDRQPLLDFMLQSLRDNGCQIIFSSEGDRAPFRITFETPAGERMGIVAYAFLANAKPTKNRPIDEYRFQLKYGTKDGMEQPIWQDPFGLYTTLLLGINLEQGFFVGIDPVLHNPTKFFISIEFKQDHVSAIHHLDWHAWERERRPTRLGDEALKEVLVGGTQSNFLRYIRFEREALGEDQGHRQLLFERSPEIIFPALGGSAPQPLPSPPRLHQLAREFELSETEILDLITQARRLKMAVRGWVAEEHLVRTLKTVPGVSDCQRIDEEGGPDVQLRFEASRVLNVECKNVLRQRTSQYLARMDFQRTRASKNDPQSRYYGAGDFDVVAACLHAVTERWEFKYARTAWLEQHARFPAKLSSNVKIDERWERPVVDVLREAAQHAAGPH